MTIQNNKHAYVDPVCRMKIIKPSKVQPFTFHADTYYFCAEVCREAFISNPAKYLQTKGPQKKAYGQGIWIDLTRQPVGKTKTASAVACTDLDYTEILGKLGYLPEGNNDTLTNCINSTG